MPVRKIPKSYRNITGRISFRGKSLAFESPLERDFYRLVDFDPEVADAEEQPAEVHWIDEQGRNRRCYPDILVTYRNPVRKPLLCEVKDRPTLFDEWRDLKPKLKAARAYATRNGWKYKIFTEKEIRTPYLENVEFLRGYRDMEIDHLHRQRLLNALRFADGWTVYKLMSSVAADVRVDPADMLTVVWHVIAMHLVAVNLHLELTMDTPIAALSRASQ